jgi:hypothetical protein
MFNPRSSIFSWSKFSYSLSRCRKYEANHGSLVLIKSRVRFCFWLKKDPSSGVEGWCSFLSIYPKRGTFPSGITKSSLEAKQIGANSSSLFEIKLSLCPICLWPVHITQSVVWFNQLSPWFPLFSHFIFDKP